LATVGVERGPWSDSLTNGWSLWNHSTLLLR